MDDRLKPDFIADQNAAHDERHASQLARLADELTAGGIDVAAIMRALQDFSVAVPSWGVGTGGTRFARFPGPGEPRTIEEKLQDCAVINDLVRCCPAVSPHFPWDWTDDAAGLSARASELGLHFDAVNSNTFQDQPGQSHSYKYGSLTHTDKSVRDQAIAHNLDCIAIGETLGSTALTVWIADGSNFPGQSDLTSAFDRYLDSMREIYAALPEGWSLFIEHKLFEPAFYSTVIQDWGTNYIAANELGPKAKCLVDLGHHAPNTNIEMIVARLARFGKLGGFHFNDSKYGDDDLDTGAIAPFQLFLVFNELVEASIRYGEAFSPAYMMDQSHNVTDPIESLMLSAETIMETYAKALIVDRTRLHAAQADNDVILAASTLRNAFRTDMRPLVREARQQKGGALDLIGTYRASGYRERAAETRPQITPSGGGIV